MKLRFFVCFLAQEHCALFNFLYPLPPTLVSAEATEKALASTLLCILVFSSSLSQQRRENRFVELLVIALEILFTLQLEDLFVLEIVFEKRRHCPAPGI